MENILGVATGRNVNTTHPQDNVDPRTAASIKPAVQRAMNNAAQAFLEIDALDARVDALEADSTAQDARLDTLEAGATAQAATNTSDDARLDALEADSTAQDARLDTLEGLPVFSIGKGIQRRFVFAHSAAGGAVAVDLGATQPVAPKISFADAGFYPASAAHPFPDPTKRFAIPQSGRYLVSARAVFDFTPTGEECKIYPSVWTTAGASNLFEIDALEYASFNNQAVRCALDAVLTLAAGDEIQLTAYVSPRTVGSTGYGYFSIVRVG